MRSPAGLIALVLCSTPAIVRSQPHPNSSAQSTLQHLRAAQSQLLNQLEINQSVRESLALRGSQLTAVIRQIVTARVNYNAEIERMNRSCRDPDEVAPQQAPEGRCAIWQADLKARLSEIESATVEVKQQVLGLQKHDQTRVREADQLRRELMSSVKESLGLCKRLSPRARSSECRAPPSAGSKTSELVASIQAMFDAIENPCAGMTSIQARIDCERQGWDGSAHSAAAMPVPNPGEKWVGRQTPPNSPDAL